MAGTTSRIPRNVLAAKRSLLRTLASEPGVTGVGIERNGEQEFMLVVLLEPGADRTRMALPDLIEGVPVTARPVPGPEKHGGRSPGPVP